MAIDEADRAHRAGNELLAPRIGLAGKTDGNPRRTPPIRNERTIKLELGYEHHTISKPISATSRRASGGDGHRIRGRLLHHLGQAGSPRSRLIDDD